MADADGWGDLFAAAAGEGAGVIPSIDPSTAQSAAAKRGRGDDSDYSDADAKDAERTSKKKKARKGKKKAKGGRQKHSSSRARHRQDGLRSRMLASRMDLSPRVTRRWPSWLRPGPSLLDGQCRGYAGRYDTGSAYGDYVDDDEEVHRRRRRRCEGDHRVYGGKERKCTECGGSPLQHAVELRDASAFGGGGEESNATEALRLFAANRNIRACASNALAARRKKSKGSSVDSRALGRYARVAKRIATEASSLCHSLSAALSTGEGATLGDKCSSLVRAVTAWCARKGGGSFDDAIRVVIASDAFYYRLYYLQLIGELPILELEGDTAGGGLAHVPHPTAYFLPDYLCWDGVSGERCIEKSLVGTLESMSRDERDAYDQYLVGRHGQMRAESSAAGDDEYHHPLSLLRYDRFVETYIHFSSSGWARERKRDFERALKDSPTSGRDKERSSENEFYASQESPAPELLMQWRDSCRDFLCNLYAYATLDPKIIGQLRAHQGSEPVIEPGAGTGYVSRLLQNCGMDVSPYDVAPSPKTAQDTMNEYHGYTPSFSQVGGGGLETLKGKLRQAKGRAPALLLCYPPPLSSMASDALQTFIGAGGKTVIHIGEWQGLTGSPKFERLLVTSFKCVYRRANPSWGSDASSTSIWERRGDAVAGETNAANIVMPCSSCGRNPAIRRCRLVRSLSYCSKECYERHELVRAAHFRCSSVPQSLVQVPFETGDGSYFTCLNPDPGRR